MNRKILIYGLGVSGWSALKLALREKACISLVSRGRVEDWWSDTIPSSVQAFSEEDISGWQKALREAEKVILSPGIPRTRPLVQEALAQNKEVLGEIDFAWDFLNLETVIALTGTNGKSTTAVMLRDVLQQAGHTVFLGGNIGTPLCDYVLQGNYCQFIVLELSSFQLETLRFFKPHLAILLNIEKHHGERYANPYDYFKAKSRLTVNMEANSYLIHLDTLEMTKLFEHQNIQTIKVSSSSAVIEKEFSSFPSVKPKILGEHNLLNFIFVLKAVKVLGIDLKAFEHVFLNFCGLPHRFEQIKSPLGKLVINDSKSTNFKSTQTALQSLKDYRGNITLILGGKKRGRNDYPPPEFIDMANAFCCELILYGESGSLLQSSFPSRKVLYWENLLEAIAFLKKGPIREVILFSPAFPSFDQFKNYRVRGETFQKAVQENEFK